MSDTDKKAPDVPPAPAEERPPRSPANAGRVRSLNDQQTYGGGRGSAQADEDIERELQEAMGGLSAEELFADPTPRGSKPPADAGPPGRKKGRVLRIHGQDVFVEVPGGRSQGVLPMEQ